MTKEIYDKLMNKVKVDYEQAIGNYKTVEDCIYDAFTIAHYNEVYDMFYNFGCDNEDFDWLEDEEAQKILDYDGNFVKFVFKAYLDFSHPERHNFFCFESFTEVIRIIIEECL